MQRRSAKASELMVAAQAARGALDDAQRQAGEAAAVARCPDGHAAAAEDWEKDLPRARRETLAVADRRAKAVGHMERLLAEAAGRSRDLREARAEADRLTAETQAAAARVADAEQAAADRAAELAAAYRAYLGSPTELRIADPDGVLEALATWAATGDGANPAVAAVDDAARAAGTELGRLGAELSARRAAHAGRADDLEAEIRRLRDGGHDAPPVPYQRADGIRDNRPGAPLWKVTDFAPHVPEEQRAGIEAALEASGILDAWVTPEGNLVDGDVVLASGAAPVPGPSCSSVLVPAINSADSQAAALPDRAVAAVLAAIGLGAGTGPGPGGRPSCLVGSLPADRPLQGSPPARGGCGPRTVHSGGPGRCRGQFHAEPACGRS